MDYNISKLKDIFYLEEISGFGCVRIKNFLEAFGSLENGLNAGLKDYESRGFSEKFMQKIQNKKFSGKIYEKQMEEFEKHSNINLITYFDEDYPQNLKNIYDPPLYLFYEGNLSKQDDISISVVGSRKLSLNGEQVISKLVTELAEVGFVVVSGLAKGADSKAHKAAVDVKKRTIAILGCGIDKNANSSTLDLRDEILSTGGAVFSAFHFGKDASKYTFPERNRIVSGMSLGVLVIEAKKKSGSLITPSFAIEQNKEVFAIPGRIYDPMFEGTNRLIKTGSAKLVMELQDILDEMPEYVINSLNFSMQKSNEIEIEFTDKKESEIFDYLMTGKKTADKISEDLNMDISDVMSKLLMMELDGKVIKEIGGYFSIKIG